jgi:hypothetical protein
MTFFTIRASLLNLTELHIPSRLRAGETRIMGRVVLFPFALISEGSKQIDWHYLSSSNSASFLVRSWGLVFISILEEICFERNEVRQTQQLA